MSKVQSPKSKVGEATAFENNAEIDDLSVVDGELFEDSDDTQIKVQSSKFKVQSPKTEILSNKRQRTKDEGQTNQSAAIRNYVFLPLVFLTVALFGGLRIDARDSAFVFLKPALVCLIFAVVLLVLFFRANLIKFDGWFSENFSTVKNIAGGAVLIALFAASTQIFNSLLPEQGLPFWVVAFCFFWTLLNNLFNDFDARKLIKSLGGLFALAFVAKYLLLANLTAPPSDNFWQKITENPTKEAFTWLLDLPRFAAATGYIQFFAVLFYLLGLFLLPSASAETER